MDCFGNEQVLSVSMQESAHHCFSSTEDIVCGINSFCRQSKVWHKKDGLHAELALSQGR